jgi:trimethylamine--corrinoid protein Co-methyltransferase
MVAAIVGGMDKLRERPLLTFNTCPVSPLKLVRDCCEIIMEAARSGLAVNVTSMAMAGGTSPVTLAGTLVTHNTEVLSGLVLNQLTRKGSPVIYGSSTTAMDLRLGTASVGTPECAMINAAVARLARYYSLPCFVAGG